jgi:putative ABC transport system ATP-binding protein
MLMQIKKIEKSYGSGEAQVRALRGVSFTIDEKDFVAIYGPSGSGKTTLLTTIAGLNRPTRGETIIDGISIYRDLNSEGLAQFRNEYIGFVFQSFHLIPYLSAQENVMLPLAPQKISSSEKREMALKALERVNIPEKARSLPGELSGGQLQRVAIARAIVNEPPLILADEPTGNLDTHTRDEVLSLLESIRQNGHTIIMVTHDPENIKLARRAIGIQDGLLN